jgi:transposase
MQPPLLVRRFSAEERRALEAGLRSTDAFALRRCQMLLASARGEHTPRIARNLGCSAEAVRRVITAFNTAGLTVLRPVSKRPRRVRTAFDAEGAERLRALLHRSPRAFGKPTSLWTLELAAAVCLAEGITAERVTGETIRATLARLGVRWRRAKQWITSPDPAYARKKGRVIG